MIGTLIGGGAAGRNTTTRTIGRSARANPLAAVLTTAARHPRGATLVGGTALGGAAVAFLLTLTSIQAFLVLAGSSETSTRERLAQADADGGLAAEAALAAGATLSAAGTPSLGAMSQPTEPVSADEVISVQGIRVHRSIAANLEALINAARADGVALSGWGWRDHQTQIRLRREHCGTTEYAIYRMPSSQCRPPTARPGSSQHERGLAIDFTYAGGSISTRRSPGFKWLDANAAAYGFKNLASEPWHWSTTGR